MAQPCEISIQTAPRGSDHGVCAQDFETSIQRYLTPSHLLGLLNFSALWNRTTYIYDTAIGDNPHLIRSCLSRQPADKVLYNTLTEFIREGIVQCLFRKKVTVDGRDMIEEPKTADLLWGWLYRDKNSPDNFITQIFGDKRVEYNTNIDHLLFDETKDSVKRYDPDTAKRRFRELIREGIKQQGPLWHLVSQLPSDLRKTYERTCAEKKYFTTADLYSVIKDHASKQRSIEELLLMQGYINQQALAESIGAGVSGSDLGRGHSYRPNTPSEVANTASVTQPRTVDELLECSNFSMPAPALEILALLSPEEIIMLQNVKNTVFGRHGRRSQDKYSVVKDAIEEYWSGVCSYLYHAKPQYTQEKRKAFVYFDTWPSYKKLLQDPRIASFKELSIDFKVEIPHTGVGVTTKNPFEIVRAWLVYKPSDDFRDLQKIQHQFWTPGAAWSAADSTNVLKDQN